MNTYTPITETFNNLPREVCVLIWNFVKIYKHLPELMLAVEAREVRCFATPDDEGRMGMFILTGGSVRYERARAGPTLIYTHVGSVYLPFTSVKQLALARFQNDTGEKDWGNRILNDICRWCSSGSWGLCVAYHYDNKHYKKLCEQNGFEVKPRTHKKTLIKKLMSI